MARTYTTHRREQAIAHLAESPATTGELACALAISGQHATLLLRNLERNGAVQSITIPSDRRKNLYHLPDIDGDTALRLCGLLMERPQKRPLTRSEQLDNYRKHLASRGLAAVEVAAPASRAAELRLWAAAKRSAVGGSDPGGRGGARSIPEPDAAGGITRTRVVVPVSDVDELRRMAAEWCSPT